MSKKKWMKSGWLLRAPARGADRMHDREPQNIAVEADRAGGVEGGKGGVVDAVDEMLLIQTSMGDPFGRWLQAGWIAAARSSEPAPGCARGRFIAFKML